MREILGRCGVNEQPNAQRLLGTKINILQEKTCLRPSARSLWKQAVSDYKCYMTWQRNQHRIAG